MKRFIILATTLLMSTCSFADVQLTSSDKGTLLVDSLSAAWRSQQILPPQQHSSQDITIVYGGADIASKQIMLPPLTA